LGFRTRNKEQIPISILIYCTIFVFKLFCEFTAQ